MIRVLVVEDSKTIRQMMRIVLESDPGIRVVGEADNGLDAIRLCERLQPDVVTMDIRMPKMNGLEAIERIMAEMPRPIVVCTTTVSEKELNLTFNAIEAGAVAVIGKPGGLPGEDYDADHLITTVRAMAEVKVVRRRRKRQVNVERAPECDESVISNDGPFDLIAIGASTGGPPALHKILCGLNNNVHVPVAVVQHISPGFISGLARWLDDTCSLNVSVAYHGEILKPGHVYLAPDDHHLEIGTSLRVLLRRGEKEQRHRPSVNAMFESVSRRLGSRAIGVLLTGMGEDGATGLMSMSRAGAFTIAQDEASCVVFGMPKAAISLEAPKEILPLDDIAPRILALLEVRR